MLYFLSIDQELRSTRRKAAKLERIRNRNAKMSSRDQLKLIRGAAGIGAAVGGVTGLSLANSINKKREKAGKNDSKMRKNLTYATLGGGLSLAGAVGAGNVMQKSDRFKNLSSDYKEDYNKLSKKLSNLDYKMDYIRRARRNSKYLPLINIYERVTKQPLTEHE